MEEDEANKLDQEVAEQRGEEMIPHTESERVAWNKYVHDDATTLPAFVEAKQFNKWLCEYRKENLSYPVHSDDIRGQRSQSATNHSFTRDKKTSPAEQLRERARKKHAMQPVKTVFDWLSWLGVEDNSAFIWSFVSALMVFYFNFGGLILLAGVCCFCAWYWKGMTPQKEFFIAIFVAFVFFSIFSTVFNVHPYAFQRYNMAAPVGDFSCRQTMTGKWECQFYPLTLHGNQARNEYARQQRKSNQQQSSRAGKPGNR